VASRTLTAAAVCGIVNAKENVTAVYFVIPKLDTQRPIYRSFELF